MARNYCFQKENMAVYYHLGHKKYVLRIFNEVFKLYNTMLTESDVLDIVTTTTNFTNKIATK